MRLETPDGNCFTLVVEGYEFPDEDPGPTDDNPADDFEAGRFLIVSHCFRSVDGQWNARGPTMTTTGMQRLITWLNSIRYGNPTADGVYFTERELEFTIDERRETLRVHVSGGFVPAWAESSESVTIEFPLRVIDLGRAIADLEKQIAQYPGRPPIRNAT
jgi:hypothetical protein